MKIALSLIVFLALSVCALGQIDSFASAYEQKTIFQYGERYTLNGQKLKFKEMENYLTKFNPSGSEYKQYKKFSTRAGFFSIAMIGSYIAALTQIDKNNKLAAGLMITGFAANLIAIPISTKARKHLQKSVWFYNRDILNSR